MKVFQWRRKTKAGKWEGRCDNGESVPAPKNLVTFGETRFLSYHYVLARLLELREAVQQLQISQKHAKVWEHTSKKTRKYWNLKITQTEWLLIAQLVTVTTKVEEFLKAVSVNKSPAICILFEYYLTIQEELKKLTEIQKDSPAEVDETSVIKFRNSISINLRERFSFLEWVEGAVPSAKLLLCAMADALDIRYCHPNYCVPDYLSELAWKVIGAFALHLAGNTSSKKIRITDEEKKSKKSSADESNKTEDEPVKTPTAKKRSLEDALNEPVNSTDEAKLIQLERDTKFLPKFRHSNVVMEFQERHPFLNGGHSMPKNFHTYPV